MLFEFTLVDPDHIVYIRADDQESAEQQAQAVIQSLAKNGVMPEVLDIREVVIPPNIGEPEIEQPTDAPGDPVDAEPTADNVE